LKNQLDDKDKEAFIDSKIDGEAFLDLAGDRASFMSAGITFGASQNLVRLAKNLANEIIGRKSKYHPLHHTLHATAS
jgi:hypothetical protein